MTYIRFNCLIRTMMLMEIISSGGCKLSSIDAVSILLWQKEVHQLSDTALIVSTLSFLVKVNFILYQNALTVVGLNFILKFLLMIPY